MFKKIVWTLLIGLVFTAKVIAQNVDYYLPYPGILPDHPLYWLKMVRDRVQLVLTVKPAAKAEKYLLYADKRLGAAWALIDGNKEALGVSTLTKAEKYLEQAVILENAPELKERLVKATAKHEEVISRLKTEVDEPLAPHLEAMLVKLAGLKQELGMTQEIEAEVRVDFGEDEAVVNKVVAANALAALQQVAAIENWEVSVKEYDFGTLVTRVADKANNIAKVWIYYVNGQTPDKASNLFELNSGDKVEWKYEAVKP